MYRYLETLTMTATQANNRIALNVGRSYRLSVKDGTPFLATLAGIVINRGQIMMRFRPLEPVVGDEVILVDQPDLDRGTVRIEEAR